MCKEVVLAYFKVLHRHSHGGLRNITKTSVTIIFAPVEVGTSRLSHTRWKGYHLIQLFGAHLHLGLHNQIGNNNRKFRLYTGEKHNKEPPKH
jgi:hypothetical protein